MLAAFLGLQWHVEQFRIRCLRMFVALPPSPSLWLPFGSIDFKRWTELHVCCRGSKHCVGRRTPICLHASRNERRFAKLRFAKQVSGLRPGLCFASADSELSGSSHHLLSVLVAFGKFRRNCSWIEMHASPLGIASSKVAIQWPHCLGLRNIGAPYS